MSQTFDAPSANTAGSDRIFEELRRRWLAGELKNQLMSEIDYAGHADVDHGWDTPENRELGETIIRSGAVGAIILAGGLASRFGGTPKASVEITPGWPLLRIKLEILQSLRPAGVDKLPVLVIVSGATNAVVSSLLTELAFANLDIEVIEQPSLPQLLPSGEIALDEAGERRTSPAGHGSILNAIGRARGVDGVKYWQVSNIDNAVTSLNPAIIAVHEASGRDVTLEVVRGGPEDVGGYLIKTARGLEIAEGFQVPEQSRPDGDFFFSTNTMVLGRSAIEAGPRLPYYVVDKKLPSGQPVVQFEQLLGDLGRVVSIGAVEVTRLGDRSRFIPLKRVEDLEASRHRILEALKALGLTL